MNRSQPSQSRVSPIRGGAFSGLRRVHEIAHKVVDSFKTHDASSQSTSKIRQLGISAPIPTMQPVQPRFQPPPTVARPAPPPSSVPFAQTAAPTRLPPPIQTQAHTLNRTQPPVAFNKVQAASHGFNNRPLSTATSMTGTTISFASAPMSDSSTMGSPPPLPAPRVDSKLSWDDSFMRTGEGPKPAQPEVWRFDERGLRPLHFPLQRRPTDPYSRGIDAAVASTSKQTAPAILPPMTRPRAVTGASRPQPHAIPIEPRRKLSSFSESSVSSAEIHLAERVPVGRLAPGPAPRVFRTVKPENPMAMQPAPPRTDGMRVQWEQPMGPGTGSVRTIQRSASARQPGATATVGQPPRRILQNWNQVPPQPGVQHKPPTFTHRRAGTIDVVPGVRRAPMPQPLYEAWHEPQPMTTVTSTAPLGYFPRAIQV